MATHPYQLGATLDQNGTLHKLAQPLIGDIPAGYTDHFRDPQLIEHEVLTTPSSAPGNKTTPPTFSPTRPQTLKAPGP
ncbi:hypothetical protein [Agrilactobacillus composti]|uniref:hypothetical protein n=1 Tax=Agrilactobacillus composti TaxID=398555 RepID=UPI002284FDF2|nr:hypothetical protein [Agrilactobacillus composti]